MVLIEPNVGYSVASLLRQKMSPVRQYFGGMLPANHILNVSGNLSLVFSKTKGSLSQVSYNSSRPIALPLESFLNALSR